MVRSTKYDIAVVSGPSTRVELLIALLVNPGDKVAVPEDCGKPLIERLELQGADVCTVECDDNGMRVDSIPDNYDAPVLVYITPSRGAVMSLERRKHLADWALATGGLIIEDDCESFRTSGTNCLPAVQSFQTDGRVIYLPAPPTVLFPLLKVSAVLLPAALIQPFLNLKRFVDPETSCLEQTMWNAVLESGHFESMIAKSRSKTASSIQEVRSGVSTNKPEPAFDTFLELPVMPLEAGLICKMGR